MWQSLSTKTTKMSIKIKEIVIAVVSALVGALLTFAFMNKGYTKNTYTIGAKLGYDFNKPNAKIQLPEILHEISGLTDIDEHTLALVQDEDGIVFIYDWQKEEIIKQIRFGEGGDYEGVTKAGNSIYVLRSDGKLFEIENFESEDFKVNEYDTEIPVKNNEGLGYDAKHKRLLIAGKSKPKGDEYKGKRAVFAFDLDSMGLMKQPVYIFKEENIERFVKENKSDGEIEQNLKINPSAIAVHPITDRLFVLSSKDKLVYIFNRENGLEAVHQLDKKLHLQPEGITFLDNGDMFISNEGVEERPSLLFFSYNEEK